MPVSRLGAVEENPVALVGRAGFQPRQPIRLRQAHQLRQYSPKSVRTSDRDELNCSFIGNRENKRKPTGCSGDLTRCLLGVWSILGRVQKKISQAVPQFQCSPVIASINVLPPMQ